jgi:hypothetical protein
MILILVYQISMYDSYVFIHLYVLLLCIIIIIIYYYVYIYVLGIWKVDITGWIS